eukprot:3689142-Rhodomonas_salina.1
MCLEELEIGQVTCPICYALGGTDVRHVSYLLCPRRYRPIVCCYAWCYAMRGTDLAYGATHFTILT